MNFTIITFFTLFYAIPADYVDWGQWYRERTQELDSAAKLTELERIPILSKIVRIGPTSYSRKLEGNRLKIFLRARQALMDIPGHAEYYDKRIRKPYEEFKGPPTENYTGASWHYFNEMRYGFPVLEQLTSPETVKVMGGMLSEEWQSPEKYENQAIQSLAETATYYCDRLTLENPPRSPNYDKLSTLERLPTWQKWYAEVKAGEQTFSFKGEPKEYRFKPDGTWETISISLPPSDAPAPTKDAPEKVIPHHQVANQVKQDENRHWLWFAIPVITIFGLLAWLSRKKSKA